MKDSYGREIDYLRLSIIDRCNYRCRYCMPETGIEKISRDEVLSFEETVQLVKASRKIGVKKVRLTGGEPLVRRDLPELVEMIDGVEGIEEISLTTNGSLLSEQAEDLFRAGLVRVNVSLDATDPEVFSRLTRGGDLGSVLDGIEAAREVGLDPVKLNTVVMKGENESQILPLVEFAARNNLVLRFIELMPMGEAGMGDIEPLPMEKVKEMVEAEWSLEKVKGPRGNGPASYYRAIRGEDSLEVGFIFPLSNSFCEGCNRIRITSRGNVRPCLARDEEFGLEVEDSTVDELADRLREIIGRKPLGHLWETREVSAGEMSDIGG